MKMAGFSYMLAPIEDMTSNAFRTLCYNHGADLTFTEHIRVEGLARNNMSTWSRICFNDETPTIIQLLGNKEPSFKRFFSMFEPKKGFMGFNLNLGCPSPQMVGIGQGCAMIRRISKTKKIMQVIRDYGFKASIKMRLGLNMRDKQNKVYLNLLDAVDADFFVVHARHGSQPYSEPADFSVYEECVKTGRDIIANGDIREQRQVEQLKSIGIKGVMIGRAAILDPSIFSRLKEGKGEGIGCLKEEYLGLSEKYNEHFRYRKNILKRMGKNSCSPSENQKEYK